MKYHFSSIMGVDDKDLKVEQVPVSTDPSDTAGPSQSEA